MKTTAIRAVLSAFALTVVMLCVSASSARADPLAVERSLPGICKPSTPTPQLPDVGVPGLFAATPTSPPDPGNDPVDPAHLYETSGFSGMSPFTYDLGCSINVANWGKNLSAWGDRSLASKFVDVGQASTAAADATSRFAFDPGWVAKLLGTLAANTIGVVSRRILLPFLGLGLLACTIMMFGHARRGRTSAVASQISWIILALLIGGVAIAAPTAAASGTQQGVGVLTSSLYEGDSPAQAATDRVMEAIHYDGWLRRTFGSDESDTARTYGPALLAATRITWAQALATDPSRATSPADREARIKARSALLKEKSDAFRTVAGEVKDADPAAYRWLTGEQAESSGVAVYEAAFAVTVAFFRIAANLLMIMAVILLAVLVIMWLVALPWLVTPDGHALGRGMLDTAARAVGIVVTASVGTWLYTVYTEAVMQPGWPTWVQFLLMGLGVFLFWTALRPDRQALSLMTAGRVRGHGRFVRHVVGRATAIGALGAVAGRAAGRAVAADVRDDELTAAIRREGRLEAYGNVRSYHSEIAPVSAYEPATAPANTVPVQVYRREDTEFIPDPVPPPAGAQTEVYTRPLDRVRKEYEQMAESQETADRHRRMLDASDQESRND